MLEVAQIHFSYGRHKALAGVSFDVAPGEIVGLVGANGAGKSTLLKVLAALLTQDAGCVRLHELDSLRRPIRYRRSVGYLSERSPLYEEMTVEEYLGYRARLKGERALRIRRRINEALEHCGLEQLRRARIQPLSHGFRKRVSLAEALLTSPRLLLLDDLLAGLDRAQRRRCAETLVGLSARASVIVTGHEIAELCAWCTRFIVLREGRMTANLRTGSFSQDELAVLIDHASGAHSDEGAAKTLEGLGL